MMRSAKFLVELNFSDEITAPADDLIIPNIIDGLVNTIHYSGLLPDNCAGITEIISVKNIRTGRQLAIDTLTKESI